MNPLKVPALAAACAFVCAPHAHALLYAYDGFDYQGVANDTTLVGVDPAISSTGSSGIGTAIAGANAAGQGGTSNIFQSTGLTFGALQTRSGGGRYKNINGAAAFMGYQFTGTPPVAGSTLWTSHLVRLVVEKTSGSVISLRLNSSKTAGSGTSYLVTYSDVAGTVAARYDTAQTNGTGVMTVGTTYVVIGRFTGVGTTTGTRKATTYILNEAQFANYADGGFSDTEWDAVTSFGAGPDQIIARAEDTYTDATAFNLLANGGIQFGIGNAGSNGGLGQDVLFDEMRCASTLSEVIPIGTLPDLVTVSLSVTDAIATEPTAAVPSVGKVILSRADGSSRPVTVNLAITGTATNGSDYNTLPTYLTLPENINSVSLEVRPIGDRRVEPDETVIIIAASVSDYIVNAPSSATITIQDGPPIVAPTKLINNLAADIPQRVVVFGTSLTQSGEWSTQMKSALDSVYPGKTTLINTMGSGRNSKWGIANVKAQVIDKNPDTVFIEFAVNDAVIRAGYQDIITPAQARINLNAILDAILAAHPNCEIILQVMNPVLNGGDAATVRPNLALCQQTYRDVGKERGLLVIDHMPSWQTLLDQGNSAFLALITDGLHPPGSAYSAYVTPVILREIGAARNTIADNVMLNATNHRCAEPPSTGGVPRSTRITVSRNGLTENPLVVPLIYGGTAIAGSDYSALPSSVTIPAGASSASIEMIPLTDNEVEGVETFTVSIGAGVTAASPGKASLIIEDRAFDQWRKSQFSASDLNDPLISGDLADPDQDGFANLLEFFTGNAPKSRNAELATRGIETIGASDYLTLTYNRIPGNGLTGIPQVSDNLADWRDGPTFIQETIISDDGLIQTIKARSLTPISGDGKEFIRLKTTRNP